VHTPHLVRAGTDPISSPGYRLHSGIKQHSIETTRRQAIKASVIAIPSSVV